MAVFRVEKTRDYTVMSNHHLRNTALSLKAKGLLSLMLSLPENWDYTTKGLAKICKDGVDSICSTVKELEQHGYVTRERVRDDKGRLGDNEYVIHEQPISVDGEDNPPKRENPVLDNPVLGSPVQENPVQGKPEQENPILVSPKQAKPEQENPAQLSIKQLNTQEVNTHAINYPSINHAVPEQSYPHSYSQSENGLIDRIDEVRAYKDLIIENLDYDILVEQYDRERMDEVVELILETVCSNRPYIRIAGDELPNSIAKSRLLKLTSSHIEYVFGCIDKNTTKVHNIKAYLLSALYNAPTTMDSYYRAEVNHDLYGSWRDKP